MKDRVQVADLAQAQLKPEARPVDIYYRPQAEAVQQKPDSMITQLAEGLGKISPKLVEIAGSYIDKQAKDETAQGNQAFRDALMKDADLNKKAFKDLVDQGIIPAGASPWFQKGWREQQLRAMGEEYGRDVTLAWNQNGDIKNSDDPGKLNQFLAQQSQAFREKIKASGGEFRPTELTEVLDPLIDHYNHNVGQEHVRFRVAEIERQVDTMSRTEVAKWATRTDLSLEERALGIQEAIDKQYANGLPGSKSRLIMAEAVLDAASTSKDPKMLGLLDHLKTGDAVLSKDPQVRAKIEQVQNHIEERQRNDQRWQWAKDEHDYHERVTKPRSEMSWKFTMQQHQWALDQHNRAEQERTLNAALGDEIRNDPTQDLRKSPQFDRLSKLDPLKAQQMLHFQQVYLGAGEDVKDDNPNSVFQITKDLYTGATDAVELKNRLINGFTLGGMMTRRTFERLNEEILQYQEGKKDPILGSPEMHQLMDGIYKGIVKDINGQFGEPAIRASMSAAEFYSWSRKWSQEHQGATVSDFRKEAEQKAADLVLAGNSTITDRKDLFPTRAEPSPTSTTPDQKPKTAPPPGAVQMLMTQPWTYQEFDNKYGQGAAAKYLGAKKQ